MAGYLDPVSGVVVSLEPDTFFATGDLGRLDAGGGLSITGRKKDLILHGGVLVSPAGVRDVLLRHEAVEDAVVVGLPHDVYGEEVAAALRLAPGLSLDGVRAGLAVHCRAHLQPASVPTRFIALDQFPTGTSGKVLSREVQRLFTEPAARAASVDNLLAP
jgi:acyl-CoA synthetase (AMP-forming)/AMP-acid ligase II